MTEFFTVNTKIRDLNCVKPVMLHKAVLVLLLFAGKGAWLHVKFALTGNMICLHLICRTPQICYFLRLNKMLIVYCSLVCLLKIILEML